MIKYNNSARRAILKKQAAATLTGTAIDAIKSSAKFLSDNIIGSAKVAIPAGGLLTAWLVYKLLSPKAVADNASKYAMYATEKESVVQSLRDLKDWEINNKNRNTSRKYHDQFI